MSLAVHLLGRPRLSVGSSEGYRFRSRKSWALLAYLLLTEARPSRGQVASLLFAEADDPMRALRWSLSEVRRGLGENGSVDGDPLTIQLAGDTVVDVRVLVRGAWVDAVQLPGLGEELLEGMTVHGAPAFETWLLAQQRHLAAATEAILHEAALGCLSDGALHEALGYAVRAATMSPLDENTQALVIRLYRLCGDDEAAQRQLAGVTRLLARELGVAPGPALTAAATSEGRYQRGEVVGASRIEAVVEAGAAAVSAGAVDAGLTSLRTATRLADGMGATRLRVSSRLVLAEALIHWAGGLDEEGLATLHEADAIARVHDLPDVAARVRGELGYVSFLRAQYDRAEVWLDDALAVADGSPSVTAMALTYLGSVLSDRGSYRRAVIHLEEGIRLSRATGEPRREAYALAMLGRVHLLRGELGTAAQHLDSSIACCERDHWLAFLPWPQALRGEVQLARGDADGAGQLLGQAFARACQLGDPCWEGMSARGLALVADANGDPDRAFELIADARARGRRLSDSYIWLGAHILDAQAGLGLRHGHRDTGRWIEEMRELAARTGMREMLVRSLLHGAALGNPGDAESAALLGAALENPVLAPT